MGIKKYTKQEAIEILIASAKAYQEKLAGRRFIIVYQDAISDCVAYKLLKFTQNNFQHLTGIRYGENVSARDFYKMCLNGMLSPEELSFNPNGFTHMKLSVLPYLSELLYHKFWIGESINNDVYINADYYAGDTKCILSVGFRNGKEDFPVSLKRQSVKQVVKKENRVYAVYSQKIGAGKQWDCVYTDKTLSIDKITGTDIYEELKDKLHWE